MRKSNPFFQLVHVMVSLLQVNVYQVLDSSKMNVSQGKKLLSSRLVPIYSSGWEVFTITQAVSIREAKLTCSFVAKT